MPAISSELRCPCASPWDSPEKVNLHLILFLPIPEVSCGARRKRRLKAERITSDDRFSELPRFFFFYLPAFYQSPLSLTHRAPADTLVSHYLCSFACRPGRLSW